MISGGILEAIDLEVADAFGITISEEPLVTGLDLPGAGEGRREAGNAFNQIARFQYPHNEIPIRTRAGGLVWLDSYNPVTREIVSRKFTQLAEVGYGTGLEYLQEVRGKSPQGANCGNARGGSFGRTKGRRKSHSGGADPKRTGTAGTYPICRQPGHPDSRCTWKGLLTTRPNRNFNPSAELRINGIRP